MPLLSEVHTPAMDVGLFRRIANERQLEDTFALARRLKTRLAGRVVWNVSSTAAGAESPKCSTA